jgi:hypothetical protein
MFIDGLVSEFYEYVYQIEDRASTRLYFTKSIELSSSPLLRLPISLRLAFINSEFSFYSNSTTIIGIYVCYIIKLIVLSSFSVQWMRNHMRFLIIFGSPELCSWISIVCIELSKGWNYST